MACGKRDEHSFVWLSGHRKAVPVRGSEHENEKADSGPAAKGFARGVKTQIDRPAPGFNSPAVKWSEEWALVWTLWTGGLADLGGDMG